MAQPLSWKTILVHVDGAEARVRYATGLAKRFEASLIGIAAGLPRTPLAATAGMAMVEVASGESERVAALLDEAKRGFGALVAGAGVETEWRSAVSLPAWALVEAAAASDVVVIGRDARSLSTDGYWSVDAGDLLLMAGRPILVVPPEIPEPLLGKILVAWKNTREAKRALADALPLLRGAGEVVLLHVQETAEAATGLNDAAAYLGRHGITVRTETEKSGRSAVEDEIVGFATSAGSDLIVAGAYGHTRLRERLLGGATRALLDRSPVPCLLSH